MDRIFDFWSIPHFLFGSVTAMVVAVADAPVVAGFFATLAIAIAWEFFEIRVRISEHLVNEASDVVLPLLAYPATYLFVARSTVTDEQRFATFVVVAVLYGYSNIIAWRARFDDRDPDFQE